MLIHYATINVFENAKLINECTVENVLLSTCTVENVHLSTCTGLPTKDKIWETTVRNQYKLLSSVLVILCHLELTFSLKYHFKYILISSKKRLKSTLKPLFRHYIVLFFLVNPVLNFKYKLNYKLTSWSKVLRVKSWQKV